MLGGPLVQAATLCETAIEGKDGTISIVRMIDRMTVSASGIDAPSEMPTVTRQMVGVITLKAGKATGRIQIKVVLEKPSTEQREVWTGPMLAEGPDRGQNFILRLQVTFDQEGLYWFHVFADESHLTSMPFRLVYAPQSVGILQ
jgi:hypothetical protein